MILLLTSCAIIQTVTESPTEKLQRLETEYKTNMAEFISESGISLQSSENENVLMSMAKSLTNAITGEGLEAECLSIGSGGEATLGLAFLAEEKNKNSCIKFAGKLQEICTLQQELQKTPYVYCSVVKK
jgi:hypothetical protein